MFAYSRKSDSNIAMDQENSEDDPTVRNIKDNRTKNRKKHPDMPLYQPPRRDGTRTNTSSNSNSCNNSQDGSQESGSQEKCVIDKSSVQSDHSVGQTDMPLKSMQSRSDSSVCFDSNQPTPMEQSYSDSKINWEATPMEQAAYSTHSSRAVLKEHLKHPDRAIYTAPNARKLGVNELKTGDGGRDEFDIENKRNFMNIKDINKPAGYANDDKRTVTNTNIGNYNACNGIDNDVRYMQDAGNIVKRNNVDVDYHTPTYTSTSAGCMKIEINQTSKKNNSQSRTFDDSTNITDDSCSTDTNSAKKRKAMMTSPEVNIGSRPRFSANNDSQKSDKNQLIFRSNVDRLIAPKIVTESDSVGSRSTASSSHMLNSRQTIRFNFNQSKSAPVLYTRHSQSEQNLRFKSTLSATPLSAKSWRCQPDIIYSPDTADPAVPINRHDQTPTTSKKQHSQPITSQPTGIRQHPTENNNTSGSNSTVNRASVLRKPFSSSVESNCNYSKPTESIDAYSRPTDSNKPCYQPTELKLSNNVSYKASNESSYKEQVDNTSYFKSQLDSSSYGPTESKTMIDQRNQLNNTSYHRNRSNNTYNGATEPTHSSHQQSQLKISYNPTMCQNTINQQSQLNNQNRTYGPVESKSIAYRPTEFNNNLSYGPTEYKNTVYRPTDPYRPTESSNAVHRPTDSYNPTESKHTVYRPTESYGPTDYNYISYQPTTSHNTSYQPTTQRPTDSTYDRNQLANIPLPPTRPPAVSRLNFHPTRVDRLYSAPKTPPITVNSWTHQQHSTPPPPPPATKTSQLDAHTLKRLSNQLPEIRRIYCLDHNLIDDLISPTSSPGLNSSSLTPHSSNSVSICCPNDFKSPNTSGITETPDWAIYMQNRCRGYTSGFIDSHCHLDFLYSRHQYRGCYSQFRRENSDTFPVNYEGCVAVFCAPHSFKPYGLWTDIAHEDGVWLAFGCHPKFATEYSDRIEDNLRQCLKHPKVVAAGEFGLDYSGTFGNNKDIQQTVFIRQLKLAQEHNLPLVIHARESEDDAFDIMKQYVPRDTPIHRHCFTADSVEAKRWLDYFPNLFMGLTNVVSFPTARECRDFARTCPLDRLLLETDAPYFRPRAIPREDDIQYSHPGMAIFVAEEIARLQHVTVNQVLHACRENTRKMYGI